MRQRDDTGMVLAQLSDLSRAEALMHFAVTSPGDHLDLGLGGNVFGEIFVGQHDHAFDAEGFDHCSGVTGRAADVGFGFHRGRGVDVCHDRDAGMAFSQ